MNWDRENAEIAKRRELAVQQGGEAGIKKQRDAGKMTVRERIEKLLDRDSFNEHGRLAGGAYLDDEGQIEAFTPANYVVGFGKINERRVVVGGEDFTLKGGSPNAAGLRKSVYAEHLAVRSRVPLVRFLEGGGGSVANHDHDPRKPATTGSPVFETPRFQILAEAMGVIPIASAGLGAVAGFPAGRLVASHFSVMTRDTAQIMIGGPALVKRALGRDLSKAELGGADVHAKSGVVDRIAESEEEVFDLIRSFLGYLPQNVWQRAPKGVQSDPVDRCEDKLADIVPRSRRQAFSMQELVKLVVDDGSFFPLNPDYGPGLIVGLARLNGQPVGITANDCRYFAGAMTAECAQKMRRMIELCDTFHLPIVNFVDEPGFMIGPDAEVAGTIRYGMAAVSAATTAKVPWASIRVRKSFGVAAAAHFGPNAYVLDWPSAESGPLPLEGGVAVAYRREIEAAEDPDAKRAELEARLAATQNPYRRAESFSVHDVIDPRETRPLLCEWLDGCEEYLSSLLGPTTFMMRP
ncbi:MAG: carboxyl transferase domain-containing protein [Pseudomonadota bacterium]